LDTLESRSEIPLKALKCGARKKIEKISCTSCVKNEEVLQTAKEARNILPTVK
jgi:hypothetical protein